MFLLPFNSNVLWRDGTAHPASEMMLKIQHNPASDTQAVSDKNILTSIIFYFGERTSWHDLAHKFLDFKLTIEDSEFERRKWECRIKDQKAVKRLLWRANVRFFDAFSVIVADEALRTVTISICLHHCACVGGARDTARRSVLQVLMNDRSVHSPFPI